MRAPSLPDYRHMLDMDSCYAPARRIGDAIRKGCAGDNMLELHAESNHGLRHLGPNTDQHNPGT